MQKAMFENIKKLFAEFMHLKYVKAIYISGSAARNANVFGSDIDINIIYDNVLYSGVNITHIEILQNSVAESARIKGYNLHIQPPKALSEFWDLVRSGEPWVLNELESAVVLYDTSELIEPLKVLLKEHKIYKKHERAALLIDRAKLHLQDAQNLLFSEAIFFLSDAAVTSTQAILMYFDKFVPYNDQPKALNRFVREGLMKKSEHRFFSLLLKLYRMDQKTRIRYCKKNRITLDYLIDNSMKYLERIEHMFELLEYLQKKKQSISNYNTAIQLMSLLSKDPCETNDEEAILGFEAEIAKRNHYVPAAYVKTLRKIIHLKNLAEQKRFSEMRAEDIHETSASLKYLEALIRSR